MYPHILVWWVNMTKTAILIGSGTSDAKTKDHKTHMDEFAVRVRDISKIYKTGDMQVKALDKVSFSLKRGEFAAIVGPSGSGKSTLMNLLGTIDKPTSGEIYIDGLPISKMNGNDLASFRNKKLGFVFQAFNLITGMNAEENVELPLLVTNAHSSDRRKKADELLSGLGLGHRLQQKATNLSGGEQQRVALARALINDPVLILADEPTGNLDTRSSDDVIKLLVKICKERGVTIIMVTHNLALTKHCNRVIHIRDGKIEREEVLS